MAKGDMVLIPFPFTDLTGHKLRPALVLIETSSDLTLSFITTQLQWQEQTDIELQPSRQTGIKKPSLIRLNKIATVDKTLVLGKLGSLDKSILTELDIKLKKMFQLT